MHFKKLLFVQVNAKLSFQSVNVCSFNYQFSQNLHVERFANIDECTVTFVNRHLKAFIVLFISGDDVLSTCRPREQWFCVRMGSSPVSTTRVNGPS